MSNLPLIMVLMTSRSWEIKDKVTKTQSVSSEPGVLESWRAGMDERTGRIDGPTDFLNGMDSGNNFA